MRKLITIIIILLANADLISQEYALEFSPNGKSFTYHSGHNYYGNVDSLTVSGGPTARVSSGHASIVHLYDDGKTVLMVENGLLMRARWGERDYVNRDTLFYGYISASLFEMSADEKYILVLSSSHVGNSAIPGGYQNIFLLTRSDTGYVLVDSLGVKEQGRYVRFADVCMNGSVLYSDNKSTRGFYAIGPDNRLHEKGLPLKMVPDEFKIPDGTNDIFYPGASPNNNAALCCLHWNGNSYDSAVVIYEWVYEQNLGSEFPYFRNQVSISADGNGIAWIQTTSKPVPSALNDPKASSEKYYTQSVLVSHRINGSWIRAEKYFDLRLDDYLANGNFYLNNYQRIYFNSDNICVQKQYAELVCYSSTDKNGRAIMCRLDHFKVNGRPQGYSEVYAVVPDTVYAGECVHIHVPVLNSSPDTVTVFNNRSEHSPFILNRVLPFGSFYSFYSPDISQVRNSDTGEEKVAPGDTIWLDYWIRFSYTGEVNETPLNNFTNKAAQVIIKAVAGIVLQPKVYDPLGCINYDDGFSMECLEWASNREVWRYRRWHRGNHMCMFVEFNKKGQLAGDNTFYWENGTIAKRIIIKGDEAWRRTYYEDGALKSEQHFKDQREVGTSQSWYSDGSLKSEAKFRSHVVFNIYTYKLKVTPAMGSSAKYYHEYYPNGKLKYDAFYSWGGHKKGKWRYYDPYGHVIGEYRPRQHQQIGITTNWVNEFPTLYYSGIIYAYRRGGRRPPDF